MKRPLVVHVERLREGKTETLEEQIDPSLLDIADEELACNEPVSLSAEVYLVDTWLIVKMSLTATVVLPCSFCNEPFVLPITIEEQLHEEPLEDIKGGIFDLIPLVREAIFLAIPFYPQCGTTLCLNRDKIEKFLKKPE
jgi:uncharacterized metal-binding protein YceD (DUF177 family)